MRSLLFRILHLFHRALRPASKRDLLANPQTFLFLQYAMPLGCCVHGTPIYAAVKAANPAAKIIVATRGLGFAALQHDPNIDLLLQTSDPGESFSARRRVAHEIRTKLAQQGIAPDLILQDASNRK